MRTMTLPDFLTEEQIKQAHELYKSAPAGTFAARCAKEIIEPNMTEINRRLGQENDARYLAYACEAVFSRMSK